MCTYFWILLLEVLLLLASVCQQTSAGLISLTHSFLHSNCSSDYLVWPLIWSWRSSCTVNYWLIPVVIHIPVRYLATTPLRPPFRKSSLWICLFCRKRASALETFSCLLTQDDLQKTVSVPPPPFPQPKQWGSLGPSIEIWRDSSANKGYCAAAFFKEANFIIKWAAE